MNLRRITVAAIVAALALNLPVRPALASDSADVVAAIRQFVDGFNKGDVKTALAVCASPASIVDEFPPHEWQGPTACADWAAAYDANAKKEGITDGVVTLGTPWHVDVTGSRTYAVVPANYTYKQHGKTVTETQSILTVALQKIPAGWRITGWAWTRH